MPILTIAVRAAVELRRGCVMRIVVGADRAGIRIHVASVAVIVRHGAVRLAAIIWLNICPIATVIAFNVLICLRGNGQGENGSDNKQGNNFHRKSSKRMMLEHDYYG